MTLKNVKHRKTLLRFFHRTVSISICLLVTCATDPEMKPFRIQDFTVQPRWTSEDSGVPFVLAGLSEGAPAEFLLPNLPPVGDQGPQASGTAWAAGFVAASYLFRSKHGWATYLCSPAFLYNQLNNRKNAGIEIVHALKLLESAGCPQLEIMPYRPADYFFLPDQKAHENAGNYRIAGFGRVDYADVSQVRAHLLQGSVVIVNLQVTDNFIELDEGVWESPAGGYRGRHTMAVVGYSQEDNVFIVQNSAGVDWGGDGFVEIPYGWFVRLTGQAFILW